MAHATWKVALCPAGSGRGEFFSFSQQIVKTFPLPLAIIKVMLSIALELLRRLKEISISSAWRCRREQ
jgi:hypothetical protein